MHLLLLVDGFLTLFPWDVDTKWFLSTRLETRTKESNKYASSRVANLF
jgi:hypothetical protein